VAASVALVVSVVPVVSAIVAAWETIAVVSAIRAD
jgi:hypothetical protein